MKILQVTNVFSPTHGGSAEVPRRISGELVKRGHQVTVYTSDSKLKDLQIKPVPGVEVHAFKTWVASGNLFITPGIIKRSNWDAKRFDIIHVHGYRTFQNIFAAHYAMKFGIPYVLQAHGSIPSTMGKLGLKRLYDSFWGNKILTNASKVIAVTGIEAQQYQTMGISEDRIAVIPHGIDISEYNTLPRCGTFRERHDLSQSTRIILFLGRINKIKGLDLLVKVFADLTNIFEDVKLVIAGPDDGYLRQVKGLIRDLEIEQYVMFTGPLYEQDKLSAYVDADVFVLPSSYEIFGITVLEACACDTRVVITDRCGVKDILKNYSKGHIVPHEPGPVKLKLMELLSETPARNVRKDDEFVNTLSWNSITARVEEIYSSVLR